MIQNEIKIKTEPKRLGLLLSGIYYTAQFAGEYFKIILQIFEERIFLRQGKPSEGNEAVGGYGNLTEPTV